MKQQIILASKSPWRKRLLKKHGITCRIHVSAFKEILKHRSPKHIVIYNACGKALDVARHYEGKNAIIIGVDTIGVFKNKILTKPRDRADAKRMLKFLSGKRHYVVSGLCLFNVVTHKKMIKAVRTNVVFRKIVESELERYLKSGQWKGKAGSYAVQGRAKGFVLKIEGDITNVVGIPIGALKEMMGRI